MKSWTQIASLGRTVTPPVIPFKHFGKHATNQEKFDSLTSLVAGSAINIDEPDITDLILELHQSNDKRVVYVPEQTISDVVRISSDEECLVYTSVLYGCRAALFLVEYKNKEKDLIFSHFHKIYEAHFKDALERKVSSQISKQKDCVEKATFVFSPPIEIIDTKGCALHKKESFETCQLGDWFMSGISADLKSKTKKILLPYSPNSRSSMFAVHFTPLLPVEVNVCGTHVGPIGNTKLISHTRWKQSLERDRMFDDGSVDRLWVRILSARVALVKEGLLSYAPNVRSPVQPFYSET